MLTTPTVCDGSAMAKMINVRYPSYKIEAIGGIISDLQVLNHALI